MITKIKKLFYFPIANYFRFFAQIQLAIWKPIIIVVTGSSGKTTLLNLIESQIQNKAKYSHQANSSFGIPFNILGLRRYDLTIGEWPYLFLAAPFKAFKKPPKEKLYVVEADCDRPYEGKFLAELLNPNVTLWTNVSRTHTVNFDSLLASPDRHPHPNPLPKGEGTVRDVENAIAHEFGYFLELTSELVIVNGNSELIKQQLNRSKALVKTVKQKDLESYKVFKDRTEFKINGISYKFKVLLPKETSYSIAMAKTLVSYLNQDLRNRHSGKRSASRISQSEGRFWTSQNDEENNTFKKIDLDPSFSRFKLPPGRASVFKGIKNTTIIDSSYNATPDGVRSILGMFDLYPSNKKWLVLGDMIELGNEEKEEHEKLADAISAIKLDKIILVGPRVSKYTYPRLTPPVILNEVKDLHRPINTNGISLPTSRDQNDRIEKFTMPKGALEYLLNNLKGGEVVLFKGARFLEGIIEHLLLDKNDVKKLCRREKVWEKRRKQWGL